MIAFLAVTVKGHSFNSWSGRVLSICHFYFKLFFVWKSSCLSLDSRKFMVAKHNFAQICEKNYRKFRHFLNSWNFLPSKFCTPKVHAFLYKNKDFDKNSFYKNIRVKIGHFVRIPPQVSFTDFYKNTVIFHLVTKITRFSFELN